MMDDDKPEQTAVNDSRTKATSDTPLTQRRSSSVRGYVYFVRAGDAIKIGFSKKPPERISHIQTSNPEPLEFLGNIRGTKEDERKAHGRFWPQRIRGEWFRVTQELIDYIHEETWIYTRPQPSPETMVIIHDLTKQRYAYGGDTPIGHRHSNLIEQLRSYEFSEGERRAGLAKSIARSIREIAELKTALTN